MKCPPASVNAFLEQLKTLSLRERTLQQAIADLNRGVRETRPNWGPRIEQYLKNCEPPINAPAAWCAAAVQMWSDEAADALAVANPLDGVKQEALVQSYANWANERQMFVPPEDAEPGDLVIYSFSGTRYDHIGVLWRTPSEWSRKDPGYFFAVEGNTDGTGGREGVEVAGRRRRVGGMVRFARWAD